MKKISDSRSNEFVFGTSYDEATQTLSIDGMAMIVNGQATAAYASYLDVKQAEIERLGEQFFTMRMRSPSLDMRAHTTETCSLIGLYEAADILARHRARFLQGRDPA